MNKVAITILVIVLMLLSCGEKERIVEVPIGCPPSPPRGIISTNHVGYVTICWNSNVNEVVNGYKVYYGYVDEYDDIVFDEEYPIADVPAPADEPEWYCVDDTETQNEQWLYAVRAYNEFGLSEWSYITQGTPRSEGSITLHEHIQFPQSSGFDFFPPIDEGQTWDAPTTDIYFSIAAGISELIANPDREVDIQDYGFVGDWDIFEAFDLISYAPDSGWAPSGQVEAITGHMYMLRLDQDRNLNLYHYAKVYVTEVGPDFIKFRWAYQEDIGNRDLSPPPPGNTGGSSIRAIRAANVRKKGSDVESVYDKGSTIPPIVQRG